MPSLPPAEDLIATAAEALARRDRGFVAEEHAAFARWRSADPAHAAAFANLEEVWQRLNALRALCPRTGDTPDPDLLTRPRN